MSGIEARLAEVLAESVKGFCGHCYRPEATAEDWERYEDGDGGHLCWAASEDIGCDWSPFPDLPTLDQRRAAALAVVVAEEVTAARAEVREAVADLLVREEMRLWNAHGDDPWTEPMLGNYLGGIKTAVARAAAPPSSIGSGVGGQGGVGHERPLTGPVSDAAPSVGSVDVDADAGSADRRDA